MSTAKAIVLVRSLKDQLKFRVPSLALAEGTASDGNPTVAVGAGTAGSQSAFIKIKELPLIGTDALGLASRGFSPHVAQIVLETSTIANVALMTEANEFAILVELMKLGCKVELYMSANGNAVDNADITSGNLKASIDADMQFKSLAGA